MIQCCLPPGVCLVLLRHQPTQSAVSSGNRLVVQFATTSTRDMVEVLIALEAPALDRLPRADGCSPGRAVPPPSTAAAAPVSPSGSFVPGVGASVVGPRSVATAPLHAASPDRASMAAAVIWGGTPAAGLHWMAGYEEGWESTRRHREPRHGRHDSVHSEVLQVESTWGSRRTRATRLGEVAV